MEEKDLVQRGNTLQVKFGVTNYNTPFTTKASQEYIISGSAVFQVKVIAAQVNNGHTNIYNNLVFLKFVKLRPDDELTYTIKFSSNEFGITNKTFISDDGTWHLVHDNKKQQYTFDVAIYMDIVPSASSFATLHGDMELTDFELRGEDGSVHMHRAVLAASSPVLRRMLGGTWRETTEGHVDVPGTSKFTLQHLKDYVYLHTLPETGLEQLLLLASYYMMPDLEQKCVDKLVNSLTAQNACDLLEFAAKHKVTRLLLAILECVQSGAVKVNEMRDHFLRGE
ncbi:uncharacterized protein LOC126374207 [Pectinophora gossypiella]|uniref:BTB domain-containing protein n=1 Tax=Pectinophora gossypiella TaxID=13191 RepID=A0A1E1W731_PECGO|nr:uncharacterized protein LOC126374207 [Pectinophora gossypiella]